MQPQSVPLRVANWVLLGVGLFVLTFSRNPILHALGGGFAALAGLSIERGYKIAKARRLELYGEEINRRMQNAPARSPDDQKAMKPRHAAALALLSGTFVIQACASAPATVPASTSTAPLLCVQDAACFKQSMDAHHVASPAGTSTEQAYTKYKNCLLVQNERIIGPFALDASDFHVRQQNCFTNALQ